MIVAVGREQESAQVDALVDRIQHQGDALVVKGAPGIGKSMLLAAAAERAEALELTVLRTGGVQSETHLPFSGLHQLLLPLLPAADDLPTRQRDALLGALGLWEAAHPQTFLIGLAVLNLLSDAATRRPLLAVVEDLQWLDRPTTEVLAFVARRVRSEQIVLLMAVRDDYPTVLDGSDLPELRLDPLTHAAAEALLDAQEPELPPGARRRVLDASAGNPLALVELPRSLGDDDIPSLTTRLENAFAARLTELPAPTRALLLAAAANDGHELGEALSAGTLLTETELTRAALAPAIDAGLVRAHERRISFRHPLVRSAVYGQADPATQRAAHAALSRVHHHDPDRRAWHRAAALARPEEEVARELEEVAARARRRGAITVAVTALRRAADASEEPATRTQRLLRAAELAYDLGRSDQVATLITLTEPELLDNLQRARMSWLSEVLEEDAHQGVERVRRLIATAETVEAAGDTALALNFVRAASVRCWWSETPWELRARLVAMAERLASGDDDPELIMALGVAAPLERGTEVMERLGRLHGTRHDAAAARFLGVAASTVGAHHLSMHFLDAAIADMRAQGRVGVLAQALRSQMWNQIFCGDWHSALLLAEEALRLSSETSQGRGIGTPHAVLALLAGLRGDDGRGMALADEGSSAAISSTRATLQHARGVIALCAGRPDEALDHLLRVFTPGDSAYHAVWRLWLVGELAEAAVQARRQDEIRPLLAELDQVAAHAPLPLFLVGLRHAHALLSDEEARYHEALDADLTPWPTARARLLLAYGSWLLRRRRAAEARLPLRTARDAFDALGLLAWGERARQELRAAGEASDLRIASSAEDLTTQELHIARLAAAGSTNREIGQQLYLSHRTVSTHLYRVFRKLGVTARGQLRDALTDEFKR